MAEKITKKRIMKDKIVVYVLGYWAQNMVAPTLDEIKNYMGVSKTYVKKLIDELVEEGALKRANVNGTARNIVVPRTKLVYEDGTDIIYNEEDLTR